MKKLIILTLIFYLSGCHSSINEIKKESEDVIKNHQKSLLELLKEFDEVVEDSSQIYALHTSQTTDFWSLSKFCRNKNNKVRKRPSDLIYDKNFRESIQKLIPKKEVSNLYFKKHDFIAFGIRGVRNHNLEFQNLFYFKDSSSIHRLFENIKKIDVDEITSIESNTELDLFIFHDEHWAFTSADSLFHKAKFNCRKR